MALHNGVTPECKRVVRHAADWCRHPHPTRNGALRKGHGPGEAVDHGNPSRGRTLSFANGDIDAGMGRAADPEPSPRYRHVRQPPCRRARRQRCLSATEKIKRLQAEARNLAHEQVEALAGALADVARLAGEIAEGGEAYPVGAASCRGGSPTRRPSSRRLCRRSSTASERRRRAASDFALRREEDKLARGAN